ncbi:MAG TPA: MBL fold metallo-hydrolase [Pyrinomonadaceae bacterium]|nr:MBL fold metallo-hydrolase [Pyrinomonadaceae bacterium]
MNQSIRAEALNAGKMPALPADAAAVILLRHNTNPDNPEVFWVKRSLKLVFLGGFYAFPGGKAERSDAETPVASSADDPDRSAMISCAAREMFEETGVLLARGAETLTIGQRASVLDDLESGRMSWPELLSHYGLKLDANDFTFVGRWVTPPFAPKRFDTWFFLVNCPPKQEPQVTGDGELESGEWISAREAYEKWQRNDGLAAPPVLHALKTLAGGLTGDLVERFLSEPEAHRNPTRKIEFRPGYICFPLRTPTKPPATHTNCYLIYTSTDILVIDPGSPYEDEQQTLAEAIDRLIAGRRLVREIMLTHAHPDHVAGVDALNNFLEIRRGYRVPVGAHQQTAEALKPRLTVDWFIADNQTFTLSGNPPITIRALHTPGHARGHLCFHDERRGVLLSGDNVVGFGSVLIDPADGNMSQYLDSLRRMRALPNVTVLLPGHGPAVANPYEKLDEYIRHRLEREANILNAVSEGASTAAEIVARVYTDVAPKALAMAERAVLAHLAKLVADGLVKQADGQYSVAQPV